ncbi:HAMP domain-containing sensor histidine kinase [Novosphingobium sp.]|uniref:sensor histidine kinase n=1 Tax=Novosphingobium sp. TaxID=1874826 RepID=UPI0025D0FFBA|nr:HAMP domain-containing sensor histidine kinase [Novosphingobium sp.]
MKFRLASIVIRQALTSTLVMLVAIVGVAMAATTTIEQQQRDDLLRTIDADIAGLTDVMVQGGVAELRRRIIDRTQLDSATAPSAAYFLSDNTGRRIAGNIARMPAIDADHSQSSILHADGDPMIVRATRLRGGLTLVVGRSLASSARLIERLQTVIFFVAVPAILASMAAAAVVAARFGDRITVLNNVFTRFDHGERLARVGLNRSRDDLTALAGNVNSHLDRIDELLVAQREISDNIAHELRTPLVHLDTRLIRALELSVDNRMTSELEHARQDIRSIVSLFDSLLDIALAEATSNIDEKAQFFDLSELAANLAELYAASAEEASLDFSTRIAPGIMMRGEPMGITRLIANLLDNAFKYAPYGSRVRMTISEGPRIMVEDNGPGIAKSDRDRIFSRFQRVGESGGGHGLGLALVRIIAARHGLWSVYEDAEPGARFVICIAGEA